MSTPRSARFADPWTWVFLLSALGNLGNGLWMLADAPGWFTTLPAAVPDFGPLNEHFVRDIGSTFTMLGLGMLWATFRPHVRVPMLAMVTLFSGLHALVHVYDTARGLVGPAHWRIDAPLVYLPAILLAVLTALLVRGPQGTGMTRRDAVRVGGGMLVGLVVASLPFLQYGGRTHHHPLAPPAPGQSARGQAAPHHP